jgi:DNA invertase Pin-like site-specific DNA recombinase
MPELCSATCRSYPLVRSAKFFITMLAAVAELEAGMIGERTKADLAAAKARGVKLGNPRPRGATPGMERAATAARMARARKRAGELLQVIEQIRSTGTVSAARPPPNCNELTCPRHRGAVRGTR